MGLASVRLPAKQAKKQNKNKKKNRHIRHGQGRANGTRATRKTAMSKHTCIQHNTTHTPLLVPARVFADFAVAILGMDAGDVESSDS